MNKQCRKCEHKRPCWGPPNTPKPTFYGLQYSPGKPCPDYVPRTGLLAYLKSHMTKCLFIRYLIAVTGMSCIHFGATVALHGSRWGWLLSVIGALLIGWLVSGKRST